MILFRLKCRNVGTIQLMNATARSHGGKIMEILVPIGVLVVWFVLQSWVLPRFGVKT